VQRFKQLTNYNGAIMRAPCRCSHCCKSSSGCGGVSINVRDAVLLFYSGKCCRRNGRLARSLEQGRMQNCATNSKTMVNKMRFVHSARTHTPKLDAMFRFITCPEHGSLPIRSPSRPPGVWFDAHSPTKCINKRAKQTVRTMRPIILKHPPILRSRPPLQPKCRRAFLSTSPHIPRFAR
jgi:hypothetical protein